MSTGEKVHIDKKGYDTLKALYAKATADKTDSFVFQGATIVTSYAKYLLEYLKPKFENATK